MTCSGTRQLKQMFFANFKFSRHFYNKLSVRNVSTHTTPFHTLCFVLYIYTPSFCIASCWFPWGGSGPKNFRILKSHWMGLRKSVQEERDRAGGAGDPREDAQEVLRGAARTRRTTARGLPRAKRRVRAHEKKKKVVGSGVDLR